MMINFAVAIGVAQFTEKTPQTVRDLVDMIRLPTGASEAKDVH